MQTRDNGHRPPAEGCDILIDDSEGKGEDMMYNKETDFSLTYQNSLNRNSPKIRCNFIAV
jgi:hypothetical protein